MGFTKIYNTTIEDVCWQNAARCDFTVEPNRVDIWRINTNANLPLIDKFKSILTSTEITRANKYHQIKDQNRAVISRGTLRFILARYLNLPPQTIKIAQTENNKPYLADYNDLHFNTSHSGEWILIAVSMSSLGIDVELINNSFSYPDVLADNFSKSEIDYINEQSPVERFFKLWTRKEAITKASGKGLEEDLKLIPALNGEHQADEKIISTPFNLKVNSFFVSEGYLASAAVNMAVSNINFWDNNINSFAHS